MRHTPILDIVKVNMIMKEVTMWYNPILRWLLRSPLHFAVSENMMLMTYRGRKSGKSYTIPMSYLENGDVLYTISSRDRVWWRNLRGGEDVTVRVKGEDVPAWAESIEDRRNVTMALGQYLRYAPERAKYMSVRITPDGIPNDDDVAHLADEKVMVATRLK
jgi:deazaflavin-dependent oxidoreductase (nitroreductase family)